MKKERNMESIDITGTLTETLEDSDFQDLAINLGEFGIDALLDSGTLRDIPILGALLGLRISVLAP